MELTNKQIDAIKEWLSDNDEARVAICRDINNYDGSMDEFDTWDIEELCTESSNTYDIVRAVIYGSVNNIVENVRFDAYGDLETVYQSDLENESESYIDDIVEFIKDNGCNYLSYTLYDMLVDYDEGEDEKV